MPAAPRFPSSCIGNGTSANRLGASCRPSHPVADAVCGLPCYSGCRQDIDAGALCSSASTGVNLVGGPILDRWRGQDSAQNGYLGKPMDDAWRGLADGRCVQESSTA